MAARYLKRDFDDESFAIVNAINPRLDLIRKEKGTMIMSGWAGSRDEEVHWAVVEAQRSGLSVAGRMEADGKC